MTSYEESQDYSGLDWDDPRHTNFYIDYRTRFQNACVKYAKILEEVCRNAIEFGHEHGLKYVEVDEDSGINDIMCYVDGIDFMTMLFGEQIYESDERDMFIFERNMVLNPIYVVKLKLMQEGYNISIINDCPIEIAIQFP